MGEFALAAWLWHRRHADDGPVSCGVQPLGGALAAVTCDEWARLREQGAELRAYNAEVLGRKAKAR